MKAFQGKCHPVEIRRFKDQREENKHIVYTIREEMAKKRPLSQIAVLTRTNQGPRQLIGALMAYNIPFCMRDAVPNLFDHWIAKKYDRLYAACNGRQKKEYFSAGHEPSETLYKQGISDRSAGFF